MERHLKIGATVKTRLVPAYATLQIGREIKIPPPPKVGYKSVAGHTEYKDAPMDSQEWVAYSEKVSELSARIDSAKNDFVYDYAIEAYRWDGDDNAWHVNEPPDWEFPAVFERHGLKPSGNKRVDYIRYELLVLNEDLAIVLNDALGRTAPITNAEADAALGGFCGDVPGRTVARKRRKTKG